MDGICKISFIFSSFDKHIGENNWQAKYWCE